MNKLQEAKSCSVCGKKHRAARRDTCLSCWTVEYISSGKRKCVLCGSEYNSRERKGGSPFCSIKCSNALSSARAKVSSAVAKEIKNGAIKKPSEFVCVDCGNQAEHYDHRRYLEPLEVVPVCRSCNIKRGQAEDIKQFVSAAIGCRVVDLENAIHGRSSTAETQQKAALNVSKRCISIRTSRRLCLLASGVLFWRGLPCLKSDLRRRQKRLLCLMDIARQPANAEPHSSMTSSISGRSQNFTRQL